MLCIDNNDNSIEKMLNLISIFVVPKGVSF